MMIRKFTCKHMFVTTFLLALSSSLHIMETIAQSTPEADEILENQQQQQQHTLAAGAASSECYIQRDSTKLIKRVWTVGVLAIRGEANAYEEFNSTFATYLTATAGQRFVPPIEFRMKPLDFVNVFTDSEQGLVDFIYVNPSAFSCIESEYSARSLCSQVSRRVIGGDVYDLKKFGGVIATLASRDDIRSIYDLKGKTVAAASISGLGSGQLQFREMELVGMSWSNDPKQLVFTSNQGKVVNGILNGDFDVGFVRTDQIESTTDADGNPIDTSLLKIIDPKPSLQIDGVPFPFQSSTPLYPEWNVAALTHTPDDVATELQNAMLAIKTHAQVAVYYKLLNETTTTNASEPPPPPLMLCDTTDEIAEMAFAATESGGFSEWVPSLSYMSLRAMQESIGFIQNQDKVWRCVRTEEIYDSISCPAGYLKKSEPEVATGCANDSGFVCKEEFQCICSPCYKPLSCFDSIGIAGQCVEYEVFLPALLVPIALLFIVACFTALGFKSKQMVSQAKQAAKNERDLNEFIAHEVRNPLSAALSASVFVTSAIQSDLNEEQRDRVREDAHIISSSLRFINDLLRNMLDVQRATRDQMELEMDSIDILHDIFQPTACMIYARDTNFKVEVDCPAGLVVRSDKLRLQQVVLNLARNSAKFVLDGFIRLRAEVINDRVHLYVEDSGPGIPKEKRGDLFNKYQKSLDSLAQGTGVGLSLVEKLVKLMDGSIWLDESYISGHGDYPGTRMVIDLNQPLCDQEIIDGSDSDVIDVEKMIDFAIPVGLDQELPRDYKVLIVDDDRNLRNLAKRALWQIRPDWNIQEAASGEACLHLCETETFDLVFMDQYMCSVEQSLKGTEAVRILRTRGCQSIICGISANNLESVFERAGADMFHQKPFPHLPNDLTILLVELIRKRRNKVSNLSSMESNDGLPPHLSVLFCDDDRILRRLAIRALKNILPDSQVQEASSGENALQLCESEEFDLIFMDQYMTSSTADSVLLGSQTVEELRRVGCKSVIVGVSANQQQETFLTAGADYFWLKPFPCEASSLRNALSGILSHGDKSNQATIDV